MPKKPIKKTNTKRVPDPVVPVEQESWWEQALRMLRSRQFRLISGLLLIGLAVFVGLSCVSFFIHGSADESILNATGNDAESRRGVGNWVGYVGAMTGRFLVNDAFGFSSLLFVLLLVVYGLQLIDAYKTSSIRWFFCTMFLLVWSSITLGFVQNLTGLRRFLWWGGAHGDAMSRWIESYIQPVGLILVLALTMVIYLILTSAGFIERLQRLGRWIKSWFVKPDYSEEDLFATPQEAEGAIEVSDSGEQTVLFDGHGDMVRIDTAGMSGVEMAEPQVVSTQLEVVVSEAAPEEEEVGVKEEIGAISTEPEGAQDEIEQVVPDLEVVPTVTPQPQAASAAVAAPEGQDKVGFTIEETKAVETSAQLTPEAVLEQQGPYDPRKDLEHYKFPSLKLLKVYDNESKPIVDREEQQANANRIVTTLHNYGIEIESIKATVGPTVTLYEVVPKAGIRIAKIQNLENDIMLSLSATGIRIIAPMPGKGTVGIEVPNEKPQTVSMHSVLASKRYQEEKKMRLPVAIGRTITNEVFMFDLAKTPHLLVAGATGQGKSVAINAILTSLLYKKHPAELKLVLVDPKMVEFAPYKPLIYHYLAAMPDTDPQKIIITDCNEVINTLNSLVIEMENRYKLLMDAGVRNLEDYNEKFVNRKLNPEKLVDGSLHHQFLPYIVIVIDEYGDFIMQVGKQVETPIARITQKARAVGMHMILATQRPSVNIVTGVIKANIPTRIALRTQSVIDSRTVLDAKGADQLIGRGDMLYSGNGNVTRIQCAFVDTPEVDEIVAHVEKQQHYCEPYPLPEYVPEGAEGEALAPGSVDMRKLDAMFADVARYVVSKQEGSTSKLQRAFEIGYNRAGKLSDQLEAAGIVGPNKGPKGRDVLIQDLDQLEALLQTLNSK